MRERGGSNTYARNRNCRAKNSTRVFWVAFTGPFPLSERDFSFTLLFSGLHFFFSFPQKESFSLRERRHKSITRITLSLSPSLEHRQTLKADINHAVSCIFRLSFSLVRSALLFLERTNARRFRFLVNCKKVAHFAFHMRTFPNAH